MIIVDDGKPSANVSHKGWIKKEHYLQSEGEFSLQFDRAIGGDEFTVEMGLAVGHESGPVLATVGDNTFVISEMLNAEEVAPLAKDSGGQTQPGRMLFLQGPSIGSNLMIGALSTFVAAETRFSLQVRFKGGHLTYVVDDKIVYSSAVAIPPAGRVRLTGSDASLRIYELTCVGEFRNFDELYTKAFLLRRAQASVDSASRLVEGDPNRPAYHFQPPANWSNDPNGMLFYDGYYHMFYQHNPFADEWEWMHWGHARSRDLVHWEHLPIALWPSLAKGEDHCFSGSGFLMDDGRPILFYTSIGHEDPEQWAAVPVDDELRSWEKHAANPILSMEDHDGQRIDSWRDPFLFRESGRTYMVVGGHPRGKKGSLMLYVAENSELTEWKYLGVALSGEDANWECPNLFRVDDHYVLIYSPHGRVEYYSGSVDLDAVEFVPQHHAAVDHGGHSNYYAPNTLQMEDGRRLLFGWINGFKKGQGWQGAITLPRDLSVDEGGRLIQKPAQELNVLREEESRQTDVDISDTPIEVTTLGTQFELVVSIENGGASGIGISFNNEDGSTTEILLSQSRFQLAGNETNDVVEIDPPLDERINSVHLFFDRSIVELFVNNGRACATWVVYPDHLDLGFRLFGTETSTTIASLKLWKMKSIW